MADTILYIPYRTEQADDKATLAQRLRAQGSDVASISLNDGVDTTKGQAPRRQQAWGEVPAGTHTTVPHVRSMAERKVRTSLRHDPSRSVAIRRDPSRSVAIRRELSLTIRHEFHTVTSAPEPVQRSACQRYSQDSNGIR